MKGILKFNEPLAPHTSWHIGGTADKYYRPQNIQDLAEFLETLSPDEPLTWLGLGSNVLIPDEGIRGTVVHMLLPSLPSPASGREEMKSPLAFSSLSPPSLAGEGGGQHRVRVVRVEAGISCAKLAKFCAREGLMGGEFFAGIPGTVGGALAMNAGAWGGETWKQVVAVEVINRRGKIMLRSPHEYQIEYRSVRWPEEEWFVGGHFQFEEGEPKAVTLRIKELLRERNAKQPTGVFSCGSVFKNPAGHSAGQLIEASNLKGFMIGGAQISPKHANFILNLGNATTRDVLQLIKHIQAVVFRNHEIHLQPEVRLLGF